MSRTVLVIDGNALVHQFAELVLGQAGLRVICAETIKAGLDVVNTTRLDLVLLDIQLPGGCGLEALAALRRTGRLTAPVMMMTVRGDVKTAKACFAAGASSYLVKPFAPADLISQVQAMLSHRPTSLAVRA